jgi:APA family basic amino acid/polyamine antiporter
MSRDGVLPRSLAPADAARDSSVIGTVTLAALASLYTLVGTFQQIVAFFFCTALGFIALSVAALFVLRRPAAGERVFRCPGYPLVPASFVLLVVVVALTVAFARPLQAAGGVAIVLAGVPVYRVLDRRSTPARIPQGAES